jgi:hypothetical protein
MGQVKRAGQFPARHVEDIRSLVSGAGSGNYLIEEGELAPADTGLATPTASPISQQDSGKEPDDGENRQL